MKRAINDFVRRKLRRLRLARGISGKDFAAQLGIPRSSYMSMETGAYNIKLDHVFKALAVLEADITEVWPSEADAAEVEAGARHRRRIQEFRLAEIASLTDGDGAALFKISGDRVRLLMAHNLGGFLLERLCFYLEDGLRYDGGFWFQEVSPNSRLLLFVKCPRVPQHLRPVIKHYMVVWSSFFSDSL